FASIQIQYRFNNFSVINVANPKAQLFQIFEFRNNVANPEAQLFQIFANPFYVVNLRML
ncbi:hypothetical protein A2U01_0038330, partial [Trifolium medium]|nr:hypothetical protein [Trifolium medium]